MRKEYSEIGLSASLILEFQMIFVFSEEVSHLVLSESTNADLNAAISRLLANYSDGHHIVLIEPRVCKAIEEQIQRFSETQRGIAKKIRGRHADYGALTQQISIKAFVVAEGQTPQRIGNDWHVPLYWIARHPITKLNLLCEDLYDITVMRAAAEDHLRLNNLNSFLVQTAALNGGGGNTHRVLRDTAVIEQNICLCIVDSDRTSPASPPGPTAAQCIEVTGNGLYTVVLTSGRSIENSVPWRLIDQLTSSTTSSNDLIRLEQAYPGITAHINFKNGFRGFDCLELKNANCLAFWNGAMMATLEASPCTRAPCTATDYSKCACLIHKGFGRSLLKEVGDWLTTNIQPSRSNKYLPSPNQADWKNLGQIVAEYAIGVRPIRL